MHKAKMMVEHDAALKHHKSMSAKLASLEGSKMDKASDLSIAKNMPAGAMHKAHAHGKHMAHHKAIMTHAHKMLNHMHKALKHVEKVAHMKPKGSQGMAQVKKLGRTYKTGGFSKIASSASKEYGSKEAGKRVAGAIFQRMAAKHANA